MGNKNLRPESHGAVPQIGAQQFLPENFEICTPAATTPRKPSQQPLQTPRADNSKPPRISQKPPRTPLSQTPKTPKSSLPVNSHDLIKGFLAAAKKDGHIENLEYTKLMGAVDCYIEEAGHKNPVAAVDGVSTAANGVVKKEEETHDNDFGKMLRRKKKRTATFKTATNFGYVTHEAAHGYSKTWGSRGAKIRGTFQDQSFADPAVSKLIESGVDCEAVLHDRAFDSSTRGVDIQEDATIIAHGFMQPVNYLGYYRMSGEKVNRWVQLIGNQYEEDVPYHNWKHGFDVFQLSFLVITDGGMSEYFTTQDCLAIMIAAVAHDVGHKGANNAYQVKAQTSLATMYNDKSPLENMHSSLAFEALQKPDANFLELLQVEDYENVRKKMIETILATDPIHHFPFVDKLKARLQTGPIDKFDEVKKDDDDAAETNKADRDLLLQGFVHMWDIGNSFRPWDIYKNVVAALEEEFFLQGDSERELGLPITMLMDREKDRLAASQEFFLGKLVLPCYDCYAKFMKDDLANLFSSTLAQNKQNWQGLIQKHGSKPANEILALEAEARSSRTSLMPKLAIHGDLEAVQGAKPLKVREKAGTTKKHERKNSSEKGVQFRNRASIMEMTIEDGTTEQDEATEDNIEIIQSEPRASAQCENPHECATKDLMNKSSSELQHVQLSKIKEETRAAFSQFGVHLAAVRERAKQKVDAEELQRDFEALSRSDSLDESENEAKNETQLASQRLIIEDMLQHDLDDISETSQVDDDHASTNGA